MSLLNKALAIKKNIHMEPRGLLSRTLQYLESRDGSFPKTLGEADSENSLDEFSNVDLKSDTNSLNPNDFFHEVSINFEEESQPQETYEEPSLELPVLETVDSAQDISQIRQKIETEQFDPNLNFDDHTDSMITMNEDEEPGSKYEIVSEFNLNESADQKDIPDIEILPDQVTAQDLDLDDMAKDLKQEDSRISDLDFGVENIPESQLYTSEMIMPSEEFSIEEEEPVHEGIKSSHEKSNLDKAVILQEKFFNIVSDTANELSTLNISENSYKDLHQIISSHFGFSKSALLIFNPQLQKFVCWHTENLSTESTGKLVIDLEYNDIYRTLAKTRSTMLTKDMHQYTCLKDILSGSDFLDSDFQLWVPYVFSSRIIGLFLGLKLQDNRIPSIFQIQSLELICRLNGPLLYNIYQQDLLLQQKKKIFDQNTEEKTEVIETLITGLPENQIDYSILEQDDLSPDSTQKFKSENQIAEINQIELSDNEISPIGDHIIEEEPLLIKPVPLKMEEHLIQPEITPVDLSVESNVDSMQEIPQETLTPLEVDLPSSSDLTTAFEETESPVISEELLTTEGESIITKDDINLSHYSQNEDTLLIDKILLYVNRHIAETSENPLSIILIQIKNIKDLKNRITNEELYSLFEDLKLVISSQAGENSIVQVNQESSIIILMPDTIHEDALTKVKDILTEAHQLFDETISDFNADYQFNIFSYPEQFKTAQDIREILSFAHE